MCEFDVIKNLPQFLHFITVNSLYIINCSKHVKSQVKCTNFRQHSKAPLTAELAFEPVAKIGRIVVKEFHGIPVRQSVG